MMKTFVKVKGILTLLLKPNPKSIALFLLLSFICIGGVIQTYAFIDAIPGLPKPPLYDQLRPFDLWVPWIFLAAPLFIVAHLFGLERLTIFYPELSVGIKPPIGSIIYVYILSNWFFHAWDGIKTKKRKSLILILGAILASFFHPPLIPLWNDSIWNLLLFSLSGFLLLTTVFSIYLTSLYGLYKEMKHWYDTLGIDIENNAT